MAFLSRLIPTFLFRSILAFHGRNISTLLFTISILSTHWLLNKVTFPHCFGSTYPLGDSIAHFLHTLFALSDSLLSAHSFVVCGAHFLWFRVTLAFCLSFALSVILSFTFLISNSVALFLLLGLCHRLGRLLALHGGGVVALLLHDDIAHILGDCLLLGLQLGLAFLLLNSVALFAVNILNLIFIFSVTLFFMVCDTVGVVYGDSVRFLFSCTLLPGLIPTFSFIHSFTMLRNTSIGMSNRQYKEQTLHNNTPTL